MPFIGNQPALSYTSFAKQDFTTSATTSYTLDHPVTNENEIALFINFVRQEPTTAYTASGTSLTLTSATSASDDMYCVFLGKAVQTVNPPSGSVGISQLSATGTKDATTFLRGDNTFASIRTNTPAFEAYLSASQTVSDNTATKAQPNTELFDTDNAYDNSSTYRFTPQVAGKYLIWGVIAGYSAGTSYMNVTKSMIYKNGSVVRNVTIDLRANPGRYIMPHVQTIQEANGSTDYFELFGTVNGTTGTQTFEASTSNLDGTRWGAYKIIE